jgi:hypothetical protein
MSTRTICERPLGGCQAQVEFVPSATSGKPMILDLAPNPDGNVVVRDGAAVVLTATRPALAGEPKRMPHQATCPKFKLQQDRRAQAKAPR